MAAIPQCLLIDLETGYLPSVTVPCHWFAPGGCAISIPCPCSTFREDDDATPHCAAALPHSLSISCNATGDSLMGRVHQRTGNRRCRANQIAIKQDSTFQISERGICLISPMSPGYHMTATSHLQIGRRGAPDHIKSMRAGGAGVAHISCHLSCAHRLGILRQGIHCSLSDGGRTRADADGDNVRPFPRRQRSLQGALVARPPKTIFREEFRRRDARVRSEAITPRFFSP